MRKVIPEEQKNIYYKDRHLYHFVFGLIVGLIVVAWSFLLYAIWGCP